MSTEHREEPASRKATRTATKAGDRDKPESPPDLKKASWSYTFRRAIRGMTKNGCLDMAAALTYFTVLSLFPATIALVSLLSLVGQEDTTDSLISMAEELVPADAMGTLEPVIESLTNAPSPGFGLFAGLAVALWTASNYVNGFSRAMNTIYGKAEGRPVWKLRPLMYLLTLALLVLVAIAAILLVISGPIAEAVGSAVGLGDAAVTVWNIARWPVLLAVVVLLIALLYYFTPNVRQPKMRWMSPGAFIAIAIAVIASLGLSLYLANFGNYDEIYGSLAGVIIALLWLWIMNLALLFGAQFDAEMERSRELQSGIAAESSIQLPLRDTTASDKLAVKEAEDLERGRVLRETRGRTNDPEEQ